MTVWFSVCYYLANLSEGVTDHWEPIPNRRGGRAGSGFEKNH
ncbi:Protein of unknown function [Bacillus mycoides]|nr:Protein of unknown function [Bacillus mycoides]